MGHQRITQQQALRAANHRDQRRWRWLWRVALLIAYGFCPVQAQEVSSSHLFPVPPALQPNIAFWTRIFTELDTNSGVLHDAVDVTVIYHTFVSLPSDRHRCSQLVDQHREHYQTILETLADHQGQPQNAEESVYGRFFPRHSHRINTGRRCSACGFSAAYEINSPPGWPGRARTCR